MSKSNGTTMTTPVSYFTDRIQNPYVLVAWVGIGMTVAFIAVIVIGMVLAVGEGIWNAVT